MTPPERTVDEERARELEALLEGITAGPWHHDGAGSAHVYAAEQGDPGWYRDVAQTEEVADARLIAQAPDLARELLAALEEIGRLREALTELVKERYGEMPDGTTASAYASAALNPDTR